MLSTIIRSQLRHQLHGDILKGYVAAKSKPFFSAKEVKRTIPLRILTVDMPNVKTPTIHGKESPLNEERDKTKEWMVAYKRAACDDVQYIQYSSVTSTSEPSIRVRCAGRSPWSSPLAPGFSSGSFKKHWLCSPYLEAPHLVIVHPDTNIPTDAFGAVPVIRCNPENMTEETSTLSQQVDNAISAEIVKRAVETAWQSAYWFGVSIGAVSAIVATGIGFH